MDSDAVEGEDPEHSRNFLVPAPGTSRRGVGKQTVYLASRTSALLAAGGISRLSVVPSRFLPERWMLKPHPRVQPSQGPARATDL